jgi:hypothetical protein
MRGEFRTGPYETKMAWQELLMAKEGGTKLGRSQKCASKPRSEHER